MKVEPQKLGSWRQNHIFQLCVLDIVNSPCICRCLLGSTVQVSACTEHKVHAHSTKCMHRTADFSFLQLQWNVLVHAVAQCRLQLESWQQCNWGPNSTVQFDGECKGTILWGYCNGSFPWKGQLCHLKMLHLGSCHIFTSILKINRSQRN